MALTRHSVVHVPIAEGGVGASLPFLFFDDGELSLLALAWARHKLLDQGIGPSSLAKSVGALGRLFDFYVVERGTAALAPDELRLLLKQFYEARRFGLKSLGWESVKVSTAADDVRAVSEFTDWCSENFGHALVNPRERVLVSSLNLYNQQAFHAKVADRKRWDLLYHLTQHTDGGRGIAFSRGFAPAKRKSKQSGEPKHFPPHNVWPMFAAARTVRDKLLLLLLFFGGLRISEPLHLFASDISIQPDGTVRVVLGHPQDGSFEWIGLDKRKRTGNRATYLAERYGLGPRNLLAENHPLRAGWKGVTYDTPKRSESVVHWLRDDVAKLFAVLHAEYIRTVRSRMRDSHPYYFVSERSGDFHGAPLKSSNATKMFNRAAERIGLSPTEDGVNPHGARHFYGFYCASILRLPVETTQKLMHHASPTSTEVYYELSAEAVRAELLKSQARLEAEAPDLLAAPYLGLPSSRQ